MCSEGIVLISTYWNVNDIMFCLLFAWLLVLISTYWNVNAVVGFLGLRKAWVLISTYWNVNKVELTKVLPKFSFNLNLLECK